MESPVHDSKLIVPVRPTLLNLARFKVAADLLRDYSLETLETAFTEIVGENSAEYDDSEVNGDVSYITVKEMLSIPKDLRTKVLDTVYSMKDAILQWQVEHSEVLKLKDNKCTFYWRPDGTIDTIKTAQEFVLNESIDIKVRFELSCRYCFDESILSLWREMGKSGEVRNFKICSYSITLFWVRWLEEGCQIPASYVIRNYLDSIPHVPPKSLFARLSSFLPLLKTEELIRYSTFLQFSTLDDLRLSLYAVTKEGEDHILKEHAVTLLRLYLTSPLQTYFMETAERLWKYLDGTSFCYVLTLIAGMSFFKEDFDYYNLFWDFWYYSPNQLKDSVKESSDLSRKFAGCSREVGRKRMADIDEETSQKRRKIS